MKKIIWGIGIIAILIIAILAITCRAPQRASGSKKITIVTTLFPIYDMARSIGGNKAEVTLLMPPGVEPHAYEPRPNDVIEINEADIFIYTGKFMEPWAKDIIGSVDNKSLLVVDASLGTRMIPAAFHDSDGPAGALDPHIWLDFDNAKIMAGAIAGAMRVTDSGNAEFYLRNMIEYENALTELDSSYGATLSKCTIKEIIYGGHYALGYLADRYGLNYLAAQGISPDAEPTANDLATLVERIRRDNIKFVFYEELTSPKIARTIAEETNAQLLPLSAAHNISKEQLESGVTFFDIMKTDLDNLKIGLGCR